MDEKLQKKKESTKKMVRAVLMPSKSGVPEDEFLREWRGLTGEFLPFKEFGFRTPFDYMTSIPDTVRITRDMTGQCVFHAIADASTQHIANLVKNQKSNKKRGKKVMSRRPKYKPIIRHHTIGRHPPPQRFAGGPPRFGSQPRSNFGAPNFGTLSKPGMSRSILAREEDFDEFDFSSPAKMPPPETKPHKSTFAVEPRPKPTPLGSNQTRTVAQTGSDHKLTITVTQPVTQATGNQFGHAYEVPPRFRKQGGNKENVPMPNSQNTNSEMSVEPVAVATPQQKPKALSRVSNSPHVHFKPAEENYRKKLQSYCKQEKLGPLEFNTVKAGKGMNKGFASSVKIRGETYGSLGLFSTPDRAEMFAAKTACDAIQVDSKLGQTAEASPPRDLDDGTVTKLKERVKEILSQRPNGVWSTRLPIEYQERFKERAPSHLVTLIREWPDIVSIEDVAQTDRQILYPVLTPPPAAAPVAAQKEMPPKEPAPKTTAPPRVPEIGMTAEVYLCTVIDCDQFYVHSADSQISEIQKLLSDIYIQEIKGRPRDLAAGSEFCAAKFEDVWYRAKIINTSLEGQIDVFYSDFGNADRIPLAEAKCLHPSLYNFPTQAIQCRLHGVFRRKKDAWDHAAGLLFELQDREDAIAMTVEDLQDGVCSVTLHPVPGDLSLNQQLVVKGLVGDCVQPKATDPEPLELPKEDEWDVIVSFVKSTNDVIVRLLGDTYSDLLSNLEDVIGSLNEDPTEAFQPSVGDICAARLQAEEGQTDNPWCRIKIDNILENDQVEVTYLDYGDNDTLALCDVRLLGPDENKLPYQAFSVSLHGLEGVEDTIVMEQLLEMALGKSFVAQVHSREEGLVSVTLWDTSTEDDININDKLMKLLDCSEFAPTLPEHLRTAECYMSHITEDGEVFLQLTGAGLQLMEQLSEEAVTHLKQVGASSFVKKPTTGKLVLALYDDLWYRAVIEELLPGRKAQVCFVDYGNNEVVQYTSLREIEPSSKRFARLPYQAVKCALDGLPPVNCIWTEDAVQKLQLLASDDILLHVEVITEPTDSTPAVVDLFLLDAEGELQSLRELLIADEAIWRESSSLPSVEDLKLSDSDVDEAALDEPTGQVDENISSTSSPAPPEDGKPDLNDNIKDTQEIQDVAVSAGGDASSASHEVCPLEQPPQELLISGELVFITWICNPHDFKLIPGKYRDGLTQMMDAMVEYYYDQGEVVDESDVKPGDIYAGLNHDQTWYRVKVKDVLEEGQVSVYFADYGDFTLIPVGNLRVLSEEFRKLPFLVIPAKLTGVEPPNKNWSPCDIQAFTELVLDKMLTVWVLNTEPTDDSGKLPVTLIDPHKLGDEALIHKTLQKTFAEASS